jgi:hypothetical protein
MTLVKERKSCHLLRLGKWQVEKLGMAGVRVFRNVGNEMPIRNADEDIAQASVF